MADGTLRSQTWDERFMFIAHEIATWSKDPSTKVGCVLVDDRRRIIGTGYNGFPRGVSDDPARYQDRPTKYLMVQHAEVNAVLQAVAGTEGATAYVTHHPCSSCAGVLIQAGIARIVTNTPSSDLESRFKDSFKAARTMLSEAGISLAYLS